MRNKGLKRAVRIAVLCGVLLATLSGCIRIEPKQPTTTQSYQPSGFRYHTGTSSYTRKTVSETDSTQPEDEPPDYPPINDDIPDYPFFDDDPEFITSATTEATSTVKSTDSTTGSVFSTVPKTTASTVKSTKSTAGSVFSTAPKTTASTVKSTKSTTGSALSTAPKPTASTAKKTTTSTRKKVTTTTKPKTTTSTKKKVTTTTKPRTTASTTRSTTRTIISKQIVRSGTSIGANANEAIYGVSKADFIAKLQISLKETAETEYWLRLLVMSEYITEAEGDSLINDCLEIKRILVATLNTAKQNNK